MKKKIIIASTILILNENIFANNEATECGGAVKFTYKIPQNFLALNAFSGNKARFFGNNFASEPFKIWYLRNYNPSSIHLLIN